MSLNTQVVQKLEHILSNFGIRYSKNIYRISFPCPIHKGDNFEGCCFYLRPLNGYFNWKCWTRSCERKIGRSPVDFVNHLTGSYEATKKLLSSIKSESIINVSQPVYDFSFLREIIVPSQYFLRRQYNSSTLVKFGVGDYWNIPMVARAVVPIEKDGKIIGCLGRSLNPICNICGSHHLQNRKCPTNILEQRWSAKWINYGFSSSSHVYNLENASEHISKTGCCIIVEGVGCVWKLYEVGIKNAVSIYGSSPSNVQLSLLRHLDCEFIIALDNDAAGIAGIKKIVDNFGVDRCILGDVLKHDVGSMTFDDIRYSNLKRKRKPMWVF